MAPFLYVLIFLTAFLLAEGLYLALRGGQAGRQAEARKRLRRLASSLPAPNARGDASILRRMAGDRTAIEELLRDLPGMERLDLLLYRAGLSMGATRFLLLSLGLALGGFAVGWVFFARLDRAILLVAFGLVPWYQAFRQARARMQKFEAQFPEALDLLTRAMRAGHSLSFGFQMIGDELADPIASEFAQVAEEVKLGQDVRTALGSMAYRMQSADLPFFVTAIAIHRETGGNLAEVLDKLGYLIRERFKLYGKIRALTAIGRASANLLAVWPFFMVGVLYFANPGYIEPLWTTPSGHYLIFIGSALLILGYWLCRKMAQIKV